MLIKPDFSIRILAALVAASLAACANFPGGQNQGAAGPGQSADATASGASSSAQGGMIGGHMAGGHGGCPMMGGAAAANPAGCPMMGGAQAGGMQGMNKEAMCAMYRSMRDAPNEQARQAMMERHMQGMSSAMRLRHMEMMRQQCQ